MIGLIKPLQGPGDTQHDCYPGDDIDIRIDATDDSYIATVRFDDLCAETTFRDTVELDRAESEWIRGELTNGGIYDITIDIEDGGSQTHEFYESCWGVDAVVEEGEVKMTQRMID